MGTGVTPLLQFVTDGIQTVIQWVSTVVNAIISDGGALASLAPLFAIGISISAIMLGVRIVKGMIWGS